MSQIKNSNFASIEQMSHQLLKSKTSEVSGAKPLGLTFQEVLKKSQEVQDPELKFSKHANERLQSRNIDLSDAQLRRLENGTKRASEKGIRESLVMVDNLAFIVNVKNNTVITAVGDGDAKVFTNIDGAVII